MDSVTPKKKVKLAFEKKVSREEAEEAVRTLIKWAGDDPKREGLRDTPKRVINAYKEFFAGYAEMFECRVNFELGAFNTTLSEKLTSQAKGYLRLSSHPLHTPYT